VLTVVESSSSDLADTGSSEASGVLGAGALATRDLLRRLRMAGGTADDGAVVVLDESPPPLRLERVERGLSSSDTAGVVAVLLCSEPNRSVTLPSISSIRAARCPSRCSSNRTSTLKQKHTTELSTLLLSK